MHYGALMSGQPLGVVIVEDHAVVGQALAALLADEPDLALLGLATSVEGALDLVADRRPDVAVLDYRLNDGTGLDAARQIADRWPGTQTVMVSALKGPDLVNAALEAGCRSFVPKDADAGELLRAVRAAGRAESYLSGEVMALLERAPTESAAAFGLTRREREVLQLSADGATIDEIAVALHLSAHTVRNHLRHAMNRLQVHTRLEAVVVAARAGIVRLGGPTG